jgi:predicted nucleic acid-binding protein
VRSVLFDANILLDVLLRREPLHVASGLCLRRARAEGIDIYVAAHSVTTVVYIATRDLGASAATSAVRRMLEGLKVAAFTDDTIRSAFGLAFPDFEDAVTYVAALGAGVEAIVTRDARRFSQSELPVASPEAFSRGLT